MRVLFAARPDDEREVRRRIDAALSRGLLEGPQGVARWSLVSSNPGAVGAEEAEHAQRLQQH